MPETTVLFRAETPKSKYLLIVNKGPGAVSLRREGGAWDLMEIYFMKADIESITQDPAKTDAEYVVFETDRNKRKFAIIKQIFERHDFWKRYDAVMMADDDLVPVGCSIGAMFNLFTETGLRVGQPALSSDSYWSHEITLQNPSFRWRKTNFIEVMCTIMTPAAIVDYLSLFDATISGFGLDNYWGWHEWQRYGGLAILDETPMRHCRPVRGGMAYRGLSPGEECRLFFQKHKLMHYMHLTLGGVQASGDHFRKRRRFYPQQAYQALRHRLKEWLLKFNFWGQLGFFLLFRKKA